MKLTNFQDYIEEKILSRGQEYFLLGHVEHVMELKNGHWIAQVRGSDEYQVDVFMDKKGDIVDSHCECPYDYGDFCKHQAAVFYYLTDEIPNIDQPKKLNVKQLVKSLKKDELIKIVLNMIQEYPELEKHLAVENSLPGDEVTEAKKVMKDFINHAKVRGFIEWNKAGQAVRGAELVLDRATNYMEKGQTKIAVLLSLTVLAEVTDMLQFCDDSSGEVGEVIYGSLYLIEEAVKEGIRSMGETDQKEVFQAILKAARHERYEGWEDWKYSLLQACVYFCKESSYRKKLEVELESMLQNQRQDSWESSYEEARIKSLILDIKEKFDSEENLHDFINANLHLKVFRERLILQLFDQREYERIVELCTEAEMKDKGYPGLVTVWKEYRYQAYEGLNNIEKQKELGTDLLIEGDFNFFAKVKNLYSAAEWHEVLASLTMKLEQSHSTETYIQVLIEENLLSKLLTYCMKHPYEVERLYPYLLSAYPAEVQNIFRDYIKERAEAASDRKKYYKVCKIIKSFEKVCGKESANLLIEELKQKYNKRPAFVDELGKVTGLN